MSLVCAGFYRLGSEEENEGKGGRRRRGGKERGRGRVGEEGRGSGRRRIFARIWGRILNVYLGNDK